LSRIQARRISPAIANTFLFVLLFGCFFSAPASAQRETVSDEEIQVLKSIYDATGGSGWIRKDNWLSDKPVGDWYGVKVRAGQVIALDLSANNLTGALPAALENLIGLDELRLQNNRLTNLGALPPALRHLNCAGNLLAGLPVLPELLVLECAKNQLAALPELPATLRSMACDSNRLTALPALPERLSMLSCSYNGLFDLPTLPGLLNKLAAGHNRLTFEDLEPVVTQLSPFMYTLSPQDSLATAEIRTVYSGDSITLSADFAGELEGNRYQWFRNGKAITEPIPNPRYTISQLTAADSGTYTCVITNLLITEFSGLTLFRRTVTLQVATRVNAQPVNVQPTATTKPATVATTEPGADSTQLHVYPNPLRHSSEVRLANTRTKRVAVTVFDPQGRMVSHLPAHPAGEKVSLSNQPKGVYLLQVSDGGATEVLRLVKLD
jgi:hypothetical protein